MWIRPEINVGGIVQSDCLLKNLLKHWKTSAFKQSWVTIDPPEKQNKTNKRKHHCHWLHQILVQQPHSHFLRILLTVSSIFFRVQQVIIVNIILCTISRCCQSGAKDLAHFPCYVTSQMCWSPSKCMILTNGTTIPDSMLTITWQQNIWSTKLKVPTFFMCLWEKTQMWTKKKSYLKPVKADNQNHRRLKYRSCLKTTGNSL